MGCVNEIMSKQATLVRVHLYNNTNNCVYTRSPLRWPPWTLVDRGVSGSSLLEALGRQHLQQSIHGAHSSRNGDAISIRQPKPTKIPMTCVVATNMNTLFITIHLKTILALDARKQMLWNDPAYFFMVPCRSVSEEDPPVQENKRYYVFRYVLRYVP